MIHFAQKFVIIVIIITATIAIAKQAICFFPLLPASSFDLYLLGILCTDRRFDSYSL